MLGLSVPLNTGFSLGAGSEQELLRPKSEESLGWLEPFWERSQISPPGFAFFFSFRSYPMVIKHGTLKTSTNGSFNGKIMDIWSVFNGQVWLLEGVSRGRTDELQSDYRVQLWSCSFTVGNQPAGSSPFCGCVVRRRSLVFFGGV